MIKKITYGLKFALGLLLGLLISVALGQTQPQGAPQANLNGWIFANAYAGWSVQANSGGVLSWPSSSFCRASSGGATFAAFTVGTPILIQDQTPNPHNEVVTVTAVDTASGNCAVSTTTPQFTHTQFQVTSATAGLQEAINANLGIKNQTAIMLTSDFFLGGGSIGQITSTITGNGLINIVDTTTAPANSYYWTGVHYALAAGGGGGGGGGTLGTLQNDLVGANQVGAAIDLYNFYATSSFSPNSALAGAAAHNGIVTLTPSVGRKAFLNTGNFRVVDERTDIPANARGVTEFGAQCDLVSNGSTYTQGSRAITVYGVTTDQSWVGRAVVTVGTVSGLPTVFESAITAVNGGSLTVLTPFPFSQSTQHATDFGHDDTAAIAQGLSVVGAGGTLMFPQGNCLTHAQTLAGQSPIGVGPNSFIAGFPGENIFQGTPGQSQGTVHHHDLSFDLDERIDATQPWQLCIETNCTSKPGLYQPVDMLTAKSNNPKAPGWFQGGGPNLSGAINGVATTTSGNAVICVPNSETAPAVGQKVVFPYLPTVYTGTVSSTSGSCATGSTARTLSGPLPMTATAGATASEWFAGTSAQNLSTAITSGTCPATITLANSINPVPGFESNVAPLGLIQIDGEQFTYFRKSNAQNPSPANTLFGVLCGVNGTTRANHSTGATVVPLNPFQPTYPWPVLPTLNAGDTTPSATAGYYPGGDIGNAVYAFPIPNGQHVSASGSFGPNSVIENLSAYSWPNDFNGNSWQSVNNSAFMYFVGPPYGAKFRSLLALYLFNGIAEGAPSLENANWSVGQPTADGTTWDQVAIFAANPVHMVTGGQNAYSNFNVYSQAGTVTNGTQGANTCFYFTQTLNDQTGGVVGIIGNTEFHNLYCEPEGGSQAGSMVNWEWDTVGGQIYDQHMGGGGEVYSGGGQQHWFSGNANNATVAPWTNFGNGNTAEWLTNLGSDPKGATYGSSSFINWGQYAHFSGTVAQAFGSPDGPYGNIATGSQREPIPSQTNETFNFGNLTAPFTSSEGGFISPEEFNSNFSFESQAMTTGWTYDAASPITSAYAGCAVGNSTSTIYCNTYKFNLDQISIGTGQRLVPGKYELYMSLKDITASSNIAKVRVYSNCGGWSYTVTPSITNAWPSTRAGFDMGQIDLTTAGGAGCAFQVAFFGATTADTIQVGFVDLAPVAENFNAQNINVSTINSGSPGGGTATGCKQSPVTGITNGYTCPANGAATSLSANQGVGDTTISVASTSGFSTSGCFFLDVEYECYSGISGSTFTGLTRGQYLTTATAHTSGATVVGVVLVLGSLTQQPPAVLAYGSSEPSIFAINNPFPYNHGGASVFSVNAGNNEAWFDYTGAIHQINTATLFANSFNSPVLIGSSPQTPAITSSGNVLQTNVPNTAYRAQTLGGGHAGTLNVIPTPTIGAPTVANLAGTASTTISYVCSGTDFDSNLINGTTTTITNGPASWTYPAAIQVVCPWVAGVNTFQIYRTAGGPDQGMIGSGTGPGYNVFDFGGSSSGGTPPGPNASNPKLVVNGVGTPCITMNNGTNTPSICWVTGAPTGTCQTGSLDLRLDGGTSTTEYVCENTAWVAK